MRQTQDSAVMPSRATPSVSTTHQLPGTYSEATPTDPTIRVEDSIIHMSDRQFPTQVGGGQFISETQRMSAAQKNRSDAGDVQPAFDHHQSDDVASDDRAHACSVPQMERSPIIAEIQQLVRLRRRWQKAEMSLILQGKALCRSWTDGDKEEANSLFDRVAAGEISDPVLSIALAPFLEARDRFTTERRSIEKTLRKLARSLPIWKSYVEGVKGFGDLRFAVIVGECGELEKYRNPSCLWKRMGLAVVAGERQRRKTDVDEAAVHGYNPERRAIAYVMSTELLKAQIRNVKDADGKRTDTSVGIGPYGDIYLARKAYELANGLPKAHANNRAARYMVKRVLRDLYCAWCSDQAGAAR